jgi:hypothetical protein
MILDSIYKIWVQHGKKDGKPATLVTLWTHTHTGRQYTMVSLKGHTKVMPGSYQHNISELYSSLFDSNVETT